MAADASATGVAALVRAGRQVQAQAAADEALAAPRLGAAQRLALLDLRAESLIAQGRFADAALDTDQMLALADAGAQPALRVQALTRQAWVLMRLGQNSRALGAAEQALTLAQASRSHPLRSRILLCAAEAQLRAARPEAALATAMQAATDCDAAGDDMGHGRAQWLIAFAQTRLSSNEPSRLAAQRAVELARRAGDGYGLANALNVLSFSSSDIAERMGLLRQAAQAFEHAGDVYGQMLVLGNLSLAFAELGLWRRACRIGEQCMDQARRAGATLNVALEMGVVLYWHLARGDVAGARARWPTYDAMVSSLAEPLTGSDRELWASALALAEGDSSAALKRLRAFLRQVRSANPGFELYALIPLAKVLLLTGATGAALRVTRRGVGLQRARSFARSGIFQSQDIWWWHSRALAASGRDDEAFAALREAHALLLAAVRNVRDEGLRRCNLNKLEVNRGIVREWLAQAARHGLPDVERLAHLALPSSAVEPFQRLVDTGMRMNTLRSAAELNDFLIDEVTELTGAERVLLVLEAPQGMQIAGTLLPAGEDAATLLQAVTPWLAEARETRIARLRHGPDGAAPVEQRSCIVAPLLAQGELLGFLYADLEGAFGRFGDADRDLLALLAGQAGVALANLRFAAGLEDQVAARTAEARAAQSAAEQRAAELAVINSIQQGLVAQLDIDAIIKLVGDRLREVFGSDDLVISWVDEDAGVLTPAYYERGVRRSDIKPYRLTPEGASARLLRERRGFIVNTRAEMTGSPVPGTALPMSFMRSPVFAGGRVIAFVNVDDFEREHAFTPADLRLLETVSAALGMALQSAHLFNETQEALARQTATSEVLQVISESPADVQPVFDVIAERAALLTGARFALLHHRMRQRVQRLRPVERDAAGDALDPEKDIVHPRASSARAMMTRMISLVPSRIWWTRRSRTIFSSPKSAR